MGVDLALSKTGGSDFLGASDPTALAMVMVRIGATTSCCEASSPIHGGRKWPVLHRH